MGICGVSVVHENPELGGARPLSEELRILSLVHPELGLPYKIGNRTACVSYSSPHAAGPGAYINIAEPVAPIYVEEVTIWGNSSLFDTLAIPLLYSWLTSTTRNRSQKTTYSSA